MQHAGVEPYDLLTITLHWLIATLILCLIALGFTMTRTAVDPSTQFALFQWHKAFGMLALCLASIRLLHSLFRVHGPLDPQMAEWERAAARTVHHLLLALTIAVPLAGWAIASVSPLNIPTFAFNLVIIPHLPLPKSEEAEQVWTGVHATLAYATLALVALHGAAALHHHLRRRDGVLLRMLPPWPRRNRPSGLRGEP